MRQYLLAFLFLLPFFSANAQLINIRTSVYFESDSSFVKKKYQNRLAKLTDTAKKLTIKGILLRGNTDADGDSLYNIRLSKKRVLAVKKHLVKAGIDDTLIHLDFYGENKPISDNNTDKGKQKNRRVDVILSASVEKNVVAEIVEDTTQIIPTDTCSKDTTFTLAKGTTINLNICEYKKLKKCDGFVIMEILTNEDLSSIGFETVDSKGNHLESVGMLFFKTCQNKCLTKPMTVTIPIDENYDIDLLKRMTLWGFDYSNKKTSSQKSPKSKLQIVKKGKKRFFKFEVYCPNLIGAFCNTISSPRKFTLKVPKGYKVLEAYFENNFPLGRYSITQSWLRNKSKTKFYYLCGRLDENITLSLKALTPLGDTAIINQKPIKNLKLRYKIFPGRCVKPFEKQCGNFMQVFGYRKSKIKIREKDFDKVISQN